MRHFSLQNSSSCLDGHQRTHAYHTGIQNFPSTLEPISYQQYFELKNIPVLCMSTNLRMKLKQLQTFSNKNSHQIAKICSSVLLVSN